MIQHIKWTFVVVRKMPKVQVKCNHKVMKSVSTFCLFVPQHPVYLYVNRFVFYRNHSQLIDMYLVMVILIDFALKRSISRKNGSFSRKKRIVFTQKWTVFTKNGPFSRKIVRFYVKTIHFFVKTDHFYVNVTF